MYASATRSEVWEQRSEKQMQRAEIWMQIREAYRYRVTEPHYSTTKSLGYYYIYYTRY